MQNIITTFAGTGTEGSTGDGGAASNAQLWSPQGVSVDISANVYIGDWGYLRLVTSKGIITTYSGATGTRYYTSVSVDTSGNLYITDSINCQIYFLAHTTRIMSTVAGKAAVGNSGDGGPATSATLQRPAGVAVESLGGVFYIADTYNHKIRLVTRDGIISTLAGTGTIGNTGDGGAATNAQLNYPQGVAVDKSGGSIYIAEPYNYRIRLIVRNTGIMTTFAGSSLGVPSTGDGGLAINAKLGEPYGVAVDVSNNVYIADYYNNNVRLVTKSTNIITTIAGTGTRGFSGDGGAATSAQLYLPYGLCVDLSGNLYIADTSNQKVRLVTRGSSPPSGQPTIQPSSQPTEQPTRVPTNQPTSQPSRQPSSQPSRQPTQQPIIQSSNQPIKPAQVSSLFINFLILFQFFSSSFQTIPTPSHSLPVSFHRNQQ